MEILELEPILSLKTPNKQETKHYIVIGAGGTGGYVIPQLSRMVSVAAIDSVKLNPDTITIIDKDLIEDKNLTRQNFVSSDLGKNKAEVMSTRYGRAFGIDIRYISEYINNHLMLVDYMKTFPKDESHFVIVDCTDNNKTRLLIHHAIEYYASTISSKQSIYYISSGNEEIAGQVSLSVKHLNTQVRSLKVLLDTVTFEQSVSESFLFNVPDICELFPDMDIDKLPEELSCAENSILSPQNIHTNYTAATIQIGLLNKIINEMPIKQFLTFFNIDTSLQKGLLNTRKDYEAAFAYVADNYYQTLYLPATLENFNLEEAYKIPTPEKMDEIRKKELLEIEKAAKEELKKSKKKQ